MVLYLNGGPKTREKSLLMVQNVRYSNGPPSRVTLPFEYWAPILYGHSDGYCLPHLMNQRFTCLISLFLQLTTSPGSR